MTGLDSTTAAAFLQPFVDAGLLPPETCVWPQVIIRFPAPNACDRIEMFGDPDPVRVVKSLCRALGWMPEDIRTEIDPDHPGGRDERARCYVLDGQDRRVAHVAGMSFAFIQVAAQSLTSNLWRPGLRTHVDPAGWALGRGPQGALV